MGFSVIDANGSLKTSAASGLATVVSSTSTGAQNNWAPGFVGNTLVEWSGASDAAITGFAGGVAGQIVTVKNTGTKVATFASQSGSSSAGNKLTNLITSIPTPIAAGGAITYQYDGTNWVILSHFQGIGIAISSPTFAANLGGTWTGVSVATYDYVVEGSYVYVIFDFQGFSITGSPTILMVSQPYSAVTKTKNLCFINDNGSATFGFGNARNDDPTNLWILRGDSTAFANASSTSTAQGQIKFKIS